MKIRIGFVSNSSSSSFVLAIKGKLTEKKLWEKFNIPKDSILYSIAKRIVNIIIKKAKPATSDEDHWMLNEKETLFCKENELTIYTGSFSDDNGDDVENMLRYSTMSYKDKEFLFKQDDE